LGEGGNRFKYRKQSWLKCFRDEWTHLGSEMLAVQEGRRAPVLFTILRT
jgi:hypothetical protein